MFGSVVRQARESRNLTQAQLAEIAGIAQSNISAIEGDRREPTASTLHQLLTACGYELVARAGERQVRFPVVPEDFGGDFPRDRVDPTLTAKQRAQVVTGVLELNEAILRSKARRP